MTRHFKQAFAVVALASVTAAAQQGQRPPTATPAQPATPAATRQTRRGIDPQAEQVMRRMSDYLSGLQNFRFQSRAADEVVLRTGQKIQQVSESRVAVQRPNHVRSERQGPMAELDFRYDGSTFSLMGQRTGYYATAPAPPTIDQAIDTLRDRLGIELPAADLLHSRPYEVMMEGVRSGTYVGLEPVGGTPAHHLAFRAQDVDWQIWIQDGAQPLPRRLVITSTNVTGSPQFTSEMWNWEPEARLSENEFTFQPPAGARRIEFLPMRAAASRQRETR